MNLLKDGATLIQGKNAINISDISIDQARELLRKVRRENLEAEFALRFLQKLPHWPSDQPSGG